MKSRCASIIDIVAQYAENCASLFEQRELVAQSLTYPSTLNDLDELDNRIDAQLDGLRMSGEDGWRIASEALEVGKPGEIFTVGVLAFEQPDKDSFGSTSTETLLNGISVPEKAVRALSLALDWISNDRFAVVVDQLKSEGSALSQAVVTTACASRGLKCAAEIRLALESNCSYVFKAGCWAAARLRHRDVLALIEEQLRARTAETQYEAAWAALLLGSPKATSALRELAVQAPVATAEMAAIALFHAVPPRLALSLHHDLLVDIGSCRATIKAAGAAGTPEMLPFILEQLDQPSVARLAGESFSAITGLDLEEAGLTTAPLLPEVSSPNDDPEDENTSLDVDEALSWPNRPSIEKWWQDHARHFLSFTRYLRGSVVSEGVLRENIRTGFQRYRTAAAQLFAISGGQVFDTTAPAFRQLQRLSAEERWR